MNKTRLQPWGSLAEDIRDGLNNLRDDCGYLQIIEGVDPFTGFKAEITTFWAACITPDNPRYFPKGKQVTLAMICGHLEILIKQQEEIDKRSGMHRLRKNRHVKSMKKEINQSNQV